MNRTTKAHLIGALISTVLLILWIFVLQYGIGVLAPNAKGPIIFGILASTMFTIVAFYLALLIGAYAAHFILNLTQERNA